MSPPGVRPAGWQLSATYFAFFACVGVEYVYLPYHFVARGLSPAEVALEFTGRIVVKTAAQPLVAWLSDRLRAPHLILKVALTSSLGAAALVIAARGLWQVALASWLLMIVRAPVIPLLDATTIRAVGAGRYGRVRLWGSAGYGAVVGLIGLFSLGATHEAAGSLAAFLYLGVVAAGGLFALLLPRDGAVEPEARAPTAQRLRPSVGFAVFLAWNALHWTTLEAYNLFFALHVRDLGLPSALPGLATAVAITSEIVALWFARRALVVAGPSRLLVLSLALGVLRWAGVALTASGGLLVALQLLHAFSFGLWWACALTVLGRFAPPEQRGALHGIFAAVVLGLGGVAGTTLGGWLLAHHGGATLFAVLAGVELCAALGAFTTRRALRLATSDPS